MHAANYMYLICYLSFLKVIYYYFFLVQLGCILSIFFCVYSGVFNTFFVGILNHFCVNLIYGSSLSVVKFDCKAHRGLSICAL